MKLNSKELGAIKEFIYLEIDKRNGIDNFDPDLRKEIDKLIDWVNGRLTILQTKHEINQIIQVNINNNNNN